MITLFILLSHLMALGIDGDVTCRHVLGYDGAFSISIKFSQKIDRLKSLVAAGSTLEEMDNEIRFIECYISNIDYHLANEITTLNTARRTNRSNPLLPTTHTQHQCNLSQHSKAPKLYSISDIVLTSDSSSKWPELNSIEANIFKYFEKLHRLESNEELRYIRKLDTANSIVKRLFYEYVICDSCLDTNHILFERIVSGVESLIELKPALPVGTLGDKLELESLLSNSLFKAAYVETHLCRFAQSATISAIQSRGTISSININSLVPRETIENLRLL